MAPSFRVHKGLYAEVSCADWEDFKSRSRRILSEIAESERHYGRFVFRGQSCRSWNLTSSFDRKFALRGRQRDDKYDRLLRTFHRTLAAFADRDAKLLLGKDITVYERHSAELEVLAQHHGLPTQLLDWSLSAYVAAFFAFSAIPTPSSNLVSIWALDKVFVDDHVAKSALRVLDNFYPKNNRQLWQLGVFVRNLTAQTNMEDIFQNPTNYVEADLRKDRPALVRFDIPVSSSAAARDDLEMMRINAVSLFPGIEGVVRWINSEP